MSVFEILTKKKQEERVPEWLKEKNMAIDVEYGYDPELEMNEEKRRNLIIQFLEYMKAKKERERARLMRSV